MQMGDVSFDPFSILEGLNPSFSLEPFQFPVWDHIGKVLYLDPRRVRPMEHQPRSDAEQARLEEMVESFRMVGQEESGLVFPINELDFDAESIGGHRRRLTCIKLGWMYRVEVKPVPSDRKQQYIKAVAGNCNREDMSILDLVKAIKELASYGCTEKEISAIVGKSIFVVRQYIALSSLHHSVFTFLEESKTEQHASDGRKLRRTTLLTVGYAVEIAKLPSAEQSEAAQAVIDEAMGADDLQHFVRQRLERNGTLRTRTHSMDEQLRLFEAALRRFESILHGYGEIPHEELMTVRRNMDSFRRTCLERRLDQAARELGRLADLFGPYNSASWHPAVRMLLERWMTEFGQSDQTLTQWMEGRREFTPLP